MTVCLLWEANSREENFPDHARFVVCLGRSKHDIWCHDNKSLYDFIPEGNVPAPLSMKGLIIHRAVRKIIKL